MHIIEYSPSMFMQVITLWKKAGIGLNSSDSEEEILRMFEKNPYLFLVGVIEEKIIAAVMGGFDGRRGFVHHLAVDPEYQNNSYGKSILDELLTRFKQIKVHKVHLFIEKDNERVVSFYEKNGWFIRDDLIMMTYIPDLSYYKNSE